MTIVAVLGAGAGGLAAAADLARAGHRVRLWNRSVRSWGDAPSVGIHYSGVLGDGTVEAELYTDDLGHAVRGAEVVMVCLPAVAHPAVFAALADLDASPPILLNPGGVGGTLELRAVFHRARRSLPPAAELSTLTYVARKPAPHRVHVTGVAGRVWGAGLPGSAAAMEIASSLYPAVVAAPDVLFTGLCNVNLVLHPPGAILAAAWIEATGGEFRFYVDGMTPGVARVLAALDDERRLVGRAYGHELPSLLEEMAAIGTVDRAAAAKGDIVAAIAGGAANAAIRAPDGLTHRYYQEDFAFGLLPLLELARIAGSSLPTAQALWELGRVLTGGTLPEGRTAARMGIEGASVAEIRALVNGRAR